MAPQRSHYPVHRMDPFQVLFLNMILMEKGHHFKVSLNSYTRGAGNQ